MISVFSFNYFLALSFSYLKDFIMRLVHVFSAVRISEVLDWID